MNEAEWAALRRRVKMQRYGYIAASITAPAAYLLALLNALEGDRIIAFSWLVMSGLVVLVARWEPPLVKVEEFRG